MLYVGQRVRIRHDLEETDYGADCANEEMIEMAGRWVTIRVISSSGNTFRIEEDCWNWTPEMLASVEDNLSPFQKWEVSVVEPKQLELSLF